MVYSPIIHFLAVLLYYINVQFPSWHCSVCCLMWTCLGSLIMIKIKWYTAHFVVCGRTTCCCIIVHLYARKQLLLSARLSHRNSASLSVLPSVCHTGRSVKNGAS